MNKLLLFLKTLKVFLLFFLNIYLIQMIISCEKKLHTTKKNCFKVFIDLVPYQDDTLQLFYKTYTDGRYYENNSIRKKIYSSSVLQHIVFELPVGIKPKNIRIDLGKIENNSIKIKNISFKYKNRTLNGDNGNYKSWFEYGRNVVIGKDGVTFFLKKFDSVFDPQINGNRELNSKLVKLFPPDVHEQ